MKSMVTALALLGSALAFSSPAHADEYDDAEYDDGEYVDIEQFPESGYLGKNTDAPYTSTIESLPPLGKVTANGVERPVQHRALYTKADQFGNDQWAAAYNFDVSSYAGSIGGAPMLDRPVGGDYSDFRASLRFDVTLVGQTDTWVRTSANIKTETNPMSSEAKGSLYLFQFQIWDDSIPTGQYTKEVPLFKPKVIDTGPYPVIKYELWGVGLNVSVSGGGSVYTNLSGTIHMDGVRATLRPGVEAHADATASLGFGDAFDIWAKGRLNVFDLSAPITARVYWTQTPNQGGCDHQLFSQLRSDLELRSLNGRIRAGLSVGWGWVRRGVTVTRWDGLKRTLDFFNLNATTFDKHDDHECDLVPPIPVISET